jgi:hypothetical protein
MEEVKLDKIREFVNRPYRPPKPVNADDPGDIQDLDEIKLHELKEVSVERAMNIVWKWELKCDLLSASLCSIKTTMDISMQAICDKRSRQWEWRPTIK